MIGSVDICDQERDFIIPELKKILESNKDKKVEVPLNLLFVISYFLRASSWYSDMNMSTVPYPSFENVSHQLSYVIKHSLGERIKRFGADEYTIYKMLAQCQWDEEDLKKLLNGEWDENKY